MSDQQIKERPKHDDPLFDLLYHPDTRDNPIIEQAVNAMRHYNLPRETTLIEMVKHLARHNALLFQKALLGEQMRPVVYHVHSEKLTREEE